MLRAVLSRRPHPGARPGEAPSRAVLTSPYSVLPSVSLLAALVGPSGARFTYTHGRGECDGPFSTRFRPHQGKYNCSRPRRSDPMHPISSFFCRDATAFGKPVCRLGLATRGDTSLTPDDVLY